MATILDKLLGGNKAHLGNVEWVTFYKGEEDVPLIVKKAYRVLDPILDTIGAWSAARGLEKKVVIAGGAFQSILANEAPRDIDVFTREFEDVQYALKSAGYQITSPRGNSVIPDCQYSVTLSQPGDHPDINVVSTRKVANPEAVISNFDISVVACALTREYICFHPYYIEDTMCKRLRFVNFTDDPHKTLLRYTKYALKGYVAEPEDLQAIADNFHSMDSIPNFDELIAKETKAVKASVAKATKKAVVQSTSTSYSWGS